MEQLLRAKTKFYLRGRHVLVPIILGIFCLLSGVSGEPVAHSNVPPANRHSREYFRHQMAATVRADHPAIVPLAAAIREISDKPLEQLVIVNDVTHLLVDYDDDERVWGVEEYHATFDEMLARRRESGWLYLRDDCDGRAVFAAHLLAALGIQFRLEASYWKEHAWVVARVDGVDYDLLDLRRSAPETNRVSYKLIGHFFVRPSHPPPDFAWRQAWRDRTHSSLAVGLQLGLLTVDSMPGRLHERYATDWTVRVPEGKISPIEDRIPGSKIAGYPYGEPLEIRNVAALEAKPVETKPGTPVASGAVGAASNESAARP